MHLQVEKQGDQHNTQSLEGDALTSQKGGISLPPPPFQLSDQPPAGPNEEGTSNSGPDSATASQGGGSGEEVMQRQIRVHRHFVVPEREPHYTINTGSQTLELNAAQTHSFFQTIVRTLLQRLNDARSNISDYNNYVRMGRERPSTTRGMGGRRGATPEPSPVRDAWNFGAAMISEWAGGAHMPWDAFDQASTIWERALRNVSAHNYSAAAANFDQFERAFNRGTRRWNTFVSRAQGGAQSSADAAQTIATISMVAVVTIATAGYGSALVGTAGVEAVAGATGLSAGTVSSVAVGGGVGGATALAAEGGRELGEFASTGDVEVDWRRMGRSMLTGAVTGAVSAGMTRWLLNFMQVRIFTHPRFISALTEAFARTGSEVPIQMYTRFLFANGERILARMGTEAIVTPFRLLAQSLASDEQLSFSDFVRRYLNNLLERGLARTVAELLISMAR